MANDRPSNLADRLDRLPLTAAERAAFYRPETAARLDGVRLLVVAAYFFNAIGATEYGGRLGAVRDRRLVEQVVGAAFQTFGDVDPHPTPLDKAAMLLRGITQGHPFNDGIKRTGFLVAAFFLKVMGYPPPDAYRIDAVVDLCVGVSIGTLRDIEIIASEIRRLWEIDEPAP